MNIEEANKLATPGPWTTDPVNKEMIIVRGTDPYQYVAEAFSEQSTEVDNATMALIAHWYNHGPKLLKALEEANKRIEILNIGPNALTLHIDSLIKDASEVEGI